MDYEIAGKQLTCPHCQGKDFQKGQAQLNTALMTYLGLDWLNKSAHTFLCKNCGRIEWFVPGMEDSEVFVLEDTDCLACGETIHSGETACRKCGWTYESEG